MYRGPIPEGMNVVRSCGVGRCVNPHHFVFKRSGANAGGESNRHAKLDWKKVTEIRSDPRPNPILAEEYGVSPGTISNIKTGYTWKLF